MCSHTYIHNDFMPDIFGNQKSMKLEFHRVYLFVKLTSLLMNYDDVKFSHMHSIVGAHLRNYLFVETWGFPAS